LPTRLCAHRPRVMIRIWNIKTNQALIWHFRSINYTCPS
jgi:hypothetical protein